MKHPALTLLASYHSSLQMMKAYEEMIKIS